MAKRLRNLRIDDVSSVDVGAGRGVRVVLHKRDTPAVERVRKWRDGVPVIYGKPITFGADLTAQALAYLKRDYSDDERQEMAGSGQAESDGSYPIKDKADLHNAIQAIGRSKNPAKTKAHIKARARALGATDELPDDWQKRSADGADAVGKVVALVNKALVEGIRKKAVDFSEAIAAADNVQDASDLMSEVRDAVYALDTSINSILCDDGTADKATAITQSYGEFKAYLESLDLEGDGDADDETSKRDADMSGLRELNPRLQEIIAAEVKKAVGTKDETISKLEMQVAYLKMKKEHQAYHDGLGSDTEKKKFTSMTDDERDQEMDKTRKRAEDDPIYKSMRAENDELRKRLDALESDNLLKVATADARAMGLTQKDAGEVLMKSRRGDQAAHKKFEEYMLTVSKAQRAQVDTGNLFSELGTARGNDGTSGTSAHDQLVAKAVELRQKDPKLSEAQAYAKVYEDPANRDLRNQERTEHFAKMGVRVVA